jgi:hypothetical protein
MTEQEKIGYISSNFSFLDKAGKEYLKNVSRQLLYIQHPIVPPSLPKKRKHARAAARGGKG